MRRSYFISFFLFLFSISQLPLCAQTYCGMNSPKKGVNINPKDLSRDSRDFPDVLRVYIHIVAHNNGSHAATSLDSIMLKYELMQQYFGVHGICFILAGIDQINNTDLDTQFVNLEESELLPYLQPDMMNIFVHDWLGNSGGGSAGGYAYDIPNPYLSLWELAVVDSNAMPLIAHEMGHCLGLYHTHETVSGAENVDRTGGCKDCDIEGDLLCDTPADPRLDLAGMLNNCTYIGTGTDACGYSYVPDPMNIMAYSPGFCQSYFTSGQAARAHYFIHNTSFLIDATVPYSISFTSVVSWSSGEYFWLAEHDVTLNSPDLSVINSAEVTFGAGSVITVYPGTTFQPQTGFAKLFVENTCLSD